MKKGPAALDGAYGEDFAAALLRWYDRVKQSWPWRQNTDPYRVLVSEIMLQQTQIRTVLGYYEPFLRQFPDVRALAAASEDEVLNAWKGLGYYRRATNLHRTAKKICTDHGGQVPKTYDALKRLPGIGDYTAAAVASIAFGGRHAVVDGNVLRIAARMFRLGEPLDSSRLRTQVRQRMNELISKDRPGDFNQAMMELGQSLCTPAGPQCCVCPVSRWCEAQAAGEVAAYPVREKTSPPKKEHRVLVVVEWDGEVLMRRRPRQGLLAGMWEFPHRELKQKGDRPNPLAVWGVEMQKSAGVGAIGRIVHRFTHLIWDIQVFYVDGDEMSPKGDFATSFLSAGYQWVRRCDVEKKALPTVMQKVWQLVPPA